MLNDLSRDELAESMGYAMYDHKAARVRLLERMIENGVLGDHTPDDVMFMYVQGLTPHDMSEEAARAVASWCQANQKVSDGNG